MTVLRSLLSVVTGHPGMGYVVRGKSRCPNVVLCSKETLGLSCPLSCCVHEVKQLVLQPGDSLDVPQPLGSTSSPSCRLVCICGAIAHSLACLCLTTLSRALPHFPPQLAPHGAANIVNHQGPLGWRKAALPVDKTVAEGQMWLHGRDAGE